MPNALGMRALLREPHACRDSPAVQELPRHTMSEVLPSLHLDPTPTIITKSPDPDPAGIVAVIQEHHVPLEPLEAHHHGFRPSERYENT
jgi:hypothetical protein